MNVSDSCGGGCGDAKSAAPIQLGRRDLLVLAGQAVAASALAGCGGSEPDEMLPATCPGVQVNGVDALQVGQVIRVDNSQQAFKGFFVCSDDKGRYVLANACLHAGCQMNFNTSAKTFDCPCHGSRYKYDGSVLQGPTTAPLKGYTMCKRQDGAYFVDDSDFKVDTSARIK